MGDSTWAIPNFYGGEISEFAQGRFDKPDYRTSLNVCLNGLPNEIGAWTRRPGTLHGSTTRGGAAGRVIKFDFEQANAITLEFTDGFLRFRNGAALTTTNDAKTVAAVSSANPAVVQLSAAVTWVTGNTVVFPAPGPAPLLENRQFIVTKIDTTHFSLADAVTSVSIDGSTLGTITTGTTIERVQELATSYIGGIWSSVRAVQAETTDILLNGAVKPNALTVTTLPTDAIDAQFTLNPAIFNDGPYLDPFTNGVQATPSAKSGIISVTLSFPVYSASTAYAAGSFVTSSGVNYRSLQDQNVGNTPVSSPTFWQVTSATAAINDGRGFLGSDIGRSVRLLSEPPLWSVTASYGGAGAYVTYNPTNKPGAGTYWVSLAANTGVVPGTDLAKWQLTTTNGALWSWGRITSLSNTINRNLAGSVNIGDLTQSGGLAAAFDGVFVKNAAASAQKAITGGFLPGATLITLDSLIGKNYSGASNQMIAQATVYPSADNGIGFGSYVVLPGGAQGPFTTSITLNLRGKMTAPANAGDGVLLGTSGLIGNTANAITIVSSDQATAWAYVWVQVVVQAITPTNVQSFYLADGVAQVSFFNPPGTGTGDGFNVEILGPPLLYTNPILTWRLGVYSETTGWPTCGCYYEGRLWLAGAVPNRFDASVSNGIDGGTIDFTPTDQNGVVAPSNAISYTLNSDSSNPIYWMEPDLAGIIAGTQAGEYIVQAPTNGPLAPANIAARRVTKIGCANIEPRRTEHTLVLVKRYRRKLMEFFSDANFGKFSAPNIADKAGHIVSAGIAELAYTQAVAPVIWGRDDVGALFGVTYKRDTLTTSQPPTFAGWHRHTLGSGRIVESICNGPSVGGDLDALTMVTNDAATGIRHVEVLTDTPDENTELTDAWFLDNAVTPTSTVVDMTVTVPAPYGGITLHGLWHLNGQTVQVFAGGLDCGDRGAGTTGYTDFLVTNGSCFVPFGDSISTGAGRGLFTADYVASGIPIVVGFTYNSDGQLVRPISTADSGARNGPALGKTRRNQQYSVLVSNTLGISFGGTFDVIRPAQFRKANGNPIDALTMFSGVHHDSLDDDYSYDGMVAWRISRPWPANLVAISGNIQTQDR